MAAAFLLLFGNPRVGLLESSVVPGITFGGLGYGFCSKVIIQCDNSS